MSVVSSAPVRLHGLDALRAAMMLLGLVLHAAVSSTVLPSPTRLHPLSHTSIAFDLLVMVIHLFRMPAFFVMAGFFGALLYRRVGAWRDAGPGRVLSPLLQRARLVRRYAAEAAYWVCLVHVIVIIWTVGVLVPFDLRARWQFLIALAAGTAVSFLSYHYGVRSTVVGAWLNGRRPAPGGRPPLPASQVA